MLNHPRILSAFLLLLMWAFTIVGVQLRKRYRPVTFEDKEDTQLVVSATLTLLGLMIGFTFSMATTRYDLRRSYEEGEASAISTEWQRAGLLPATTAAQLRPLLTQYLQARIGFYQSDFGNQLGAIDEQASALGEQLWATVVPPALAQPTPVTALTVSGINDILSSADRTQAAWWNRIPTPAWALLITIACTANLLVGYATRHGHARTVLLVVLPLLVSTAIFLIADIDSPRGGIIRVPPRDLLSLQHHLAPHRR